MSLIDSQCNERQLLLVLLFYLKVCQFNVQCHPLGASKFLEDLQNYDLMKLGVCLIQLIFLAHF